MYAITYIAFLCTDPAPKGSELLSIQLTTLGSILAGLLVYTLLIYVTRKRVKQKGWRLGAYVLLTTALAGGLAWAIFIYAISTCGY